MNVLWRKYVLSNVHIAICATALCYSGYWFFNVPPNPQILLFLFMGTLITYTLHRLISDQRVRPPYGEIERFSFFRTSSRFQAGYILLLVIIATYSFSLLNVQLRLFLAFLSLLSMAYVLPILKSGMRLRDIGLVKIFLISFVWAAIFFTAVFDAGLRFHWSYIILFGEKFIFIFALTLPFDIRDRQLDAASSVSTFASRYPLTTIQYWIRFMILICIVLVLISLATALYTPSLSLYLVAFYLLQWYLSLRDPHHCSELYYLGVLDGLMLVHAALIVLSTIFP